MIDIDLRNQDVSDMLASLPDGCAPLVHADPPWDYENWSDTKNGAARAYYDGLTMEEIAAHMNVAYRIAAPDSYLVVWCTWPKLIEWASYNAQLGKWVHITGASWHKSNGLGVGFHVRGDSEPILIYRKGHPLPLTHFSNSWKTARIGHSEKPQTILRDVVEWAVPVGGLVVDLYAGASASLAIACRSLGRQYVGAEIDAARHATALLRLSQQEMVFV
jgi:N6-adenosine-specific RNA methylase IME4